MFITEVNIILSLQMFYHKLFMVGPTEMDSIFMISSFIWCNTDKKKIKNGIGDEVIFWRIRGVGFFFANYMYMKWQKTVNKKNINLCLIKEHNLETSNVGYFKFEFGLYFAHLQLDKSQSDN